MKKRLKALDAKVAQEGLVLTEEAISSRWRRLRAKRRRMASSRANVQAIATWRPGLPVLRQLNHERGQPYLPVAPSTLTLLLVAFAKLYDPKTPITMADLVQRSRRAVP